jgi:hypothetical protein
MDLKLRARKCIWRLMNVGTHAIEESSRVAVGNEDLKWISRSMRARVDLADEQALLDAMAPR